MPDDSLTIEQVLTRLAEAPPRLADLTDGLSPAQLRASPGASEWSANEVLAHLRACADVWGSYIRRILAEDHPTFRAVSPRTWIRRTDYLDQEFLPSLHAFTTQRTELLAVLEPLPAAAWLRAATVTVARRVIEPTVLTHAERLVNHEQVHLSQVERIVTTLRG